MDEKYRFFFLLFVFMLLNGNSIAQVLDTIDYQGIPIVVDLDEFEVTASRKGFGVNDFIEMVQTDESFYKAFQNIRFLSYQSSNSITFFDKKGQQKAYFENEIQQTSDGKCREMTTQQETVLGNFFKRKGNYRYYTAKLLDRLFFTHGRACGDPLEGIDAVQPKGKMEQYILELKKLIFQPGEAVDVPMIGQKMAIFESKMQQYYDYSIQSKIYGNEIDCYVFSVLVKPKFITKAQKTVLKKLTTYFDKSSFQVIARDYQLAYHTGVYSFDVKMSIELKKLDKTYVPTFISYDGNWDIPLKKPEIAQFEIRFWDYQRP